MNEQRPTKTAEEWAAIQAMRDELEAEQEAFDRWLNQPLEWPSIP